jgi:hypothetical protein
LAGSFSTPRPSSWSCARLSSRARVALDAASAGGGAGEREAGGTVVLPARGLIPARRLGGVEHHRAQPVVGHQRQQVLGARVAGMGERQRQQVGLAVVARLEVPLGAVVVGARRRRERGQRDDDQEEGELSHGGTRDGPAPPSTNR